MKYNKHLFNIKVTFRSHMGNCKLVGSWLHSPAASLKLKPDIRHWWFTERDILTTIAGVLCTRDSSFRKWKHFANYSKSKNKKTYLTISSTKRIRIIRIDNLILSANRTPCISVKKSIQIVTVRKYLFLESFANKRFFCGQNIELVTLNQFKGLFVNMWTSITRVHILRTQ